MEQAERGRHFNEEEEREENLVIQSKVVQAATVNVVPNVQGEEIMEEKQNKRKRSRALPLDRDSNVVNAERRQFGAGFR